MQEHSCRRGSSVKKTCGVFSSFVAFAGLFLSAAVYGQPVEDVCSPDCVLGEFSCTEPVTAAFPQGTCTLERGSPVDYYTLEVPEGSEQVTINLTPVAAPGAAGWYDTYLALYDADCVLIQLDDDGGDGFNSRINTPLAAGTYHVGASSFSVAGTGQFTLSASCREPFDQAALCNDCVISEVECGIETTGTFPESGCPRETGEDIDLYLVELPPEGGRLTVTLQSTEFTPFLQLFDGGCLPVGIANGIGDTARLNVEHFGGLHFIGVSSNAFQSAGAFTLNLECREVLAPESVCPDCQVGEIACEGSAAGVFPQSACLRPESNGQEVDIYQVEVEEAQELVIDLNSPSYDTWLELYDADCNRVTFNDDGGAGLNSRIMENVEPGTYYIGVSSFGVGVGGDYVLDVTCRDPFVPAATCEDCIAGDDLDCGGVEVQGVFPQTGCRRPAATNNQEVDIYQLEIDEDQEVVIDLNSPDFDTWIELYDADCNRIAFNDDGGAGLNSLLIQNLAAGTYFVGVSSYSGGVGGTYFLATICREATDLCGDCEVGLVSCGIPEEAIFPMTECRRTTGQFLDLYSIVIAGGDLTINLTGDYDTYLQLYDENCQLIAQDDDGGNGLNSILTMMDLPGGIYRLGVSSYATGQGGGFTLATECESGDNFCVQCRVSAMEPGQSLTGTLGISECTLPPFDQAIEVYSFTVDEFFEGRISVSSDSFDPTLALFNDLCDEFAFNDNCGAGTEAACLSRSLDAGTYSIVVSSEDLDAAGDFTVSILSAEESGLFSRGDGNGDGSLELTDAIIILSYLFLGDDDPACMEAADSDNDGQINLTDGILILGYLFQGGAAPALPGPPGINTGCGLDIDAPGSPGDLGCENYSGCD